MPTKPLSVSNSAKVKLSAEPSQTFGPNPGHQHPEDAYVADDVPSGKALGLDALFDGFGLGDGLAVEFG